MNYFLTFLFLLAVGIVAVYSSSSYVAFRLTRDYDFFFKRHLTGLFLGIFVFIFFYRFNIDLLIKHYRKIWFLSLFLLFLPFIPGIGLELLGSRRWANLGFVRFQPSELVKYALVIYAATLLGKIYPNLSRFKEGFFIPILTCLIIPAIVVIEPDVSTASNLTLLILIMFFLAGARMLHLLSLASAGLPIFIYLLLTKGYLSRRFSFLSPFDDPFGQGYHLIQSFIAFRNGGIFGMGPGASIQKISSLPEAYTDFIYSIIVEEVGALGGSILIIAFMFLLYQGFLIARRQPSFEKKLIVYGFSTLVAIEQCVHILVAMGLTPTTGLPLPLISYGRSAMLVDVAMIATILNLARKVAEDENSQKKKIYAER